jgi:hypothetical protein
MTATSLSSDHAHVVADLYAAFGRGDLEAVLAPLAVAATLVRRPFSNGRPEAMSVVNDRAANTSTTRIWGTRDSTVRPKCSPPSQRT